MAPQWLRALSWVALAAGFASTGWILLDIFARGRRPKMRVMSAVWPVTGLYLGPLAVWSFRRWWRGGDQEKPAWAAYAIGVSHCGAGCTLGDIIAEWGIFGLGLTLAGEALYAEYIGDYVLALALGILFQYFAIAPMRQLSVGAGLVAALKADVLSLTAFEVGLFGWMALTSLVFFPHPHLHPDGPVYWFMMQIGMAIGFLTAYPVNVWLIRRGIKEAM